MENLGKIGLAAICSATLLCTPTYAGPKNPDEFAAKKALNEAAGYYGKPGIFSLDEIIHFSRSLDKDRPKVIVPSNATDIEYHSSTNGSVTFAIRTTTEHIKYFEAKTVDLNEFTYNRQLEKFMQGRL